MIEVKSLTKIYKIYNTHFDRLKESLSFNSKRKLHKDFFALKDISFTIENNTTVGIIGNNGSGKSTLLKLITGVLTPTSGSIETTGKITALLELGAGFNQELSGIENIYLLSTINNIPVESIENNIQEIIKFSELEDFINQPIKTYSSGMKARLAFAIAINVKPEIIIIDEILSVGDASFQRKCFAKIEEFKNSKNTILFVSHSLGQINELCDKVIWINRGELVISGETKLVTSLYQKYGSQKELNHSHIKEEYFKAKEVIHSKKFSKVNSNSFFNKNIISKSKVAYELNGAEISDVKVTDLNNNLVNIIQKNESYIFSYRVKLFTTIKKFNLVMSIRTKTGIQLSGYTKKIINNKNSQEFHIKFKFNTLLNPNYYFFNCAINSISDEKKTIHHRIVDAYMVQVINKEKKDSSHGIFDIVEFKEVDII